MPLFSIRPRVCQALIFLALLPLASKLLCSPAFADDGAASIAAGGIVMIHEPRITMHKEVLRISAEKVSVDYEFRNDTDSDITTEVAFPVPAYSLMWDEYLISTLGFDDFRLTVEGKPVHFGIETKAKLNGKDVSALLDRYGIDIATFGHFNQDTHYAKDIRSLSAAQRSALVRDGLINPETDQDEASWNVEKKYYWKQTFPAHAIIHISHQYTPIPGGMNSVRYGLVQEDPGAANELASLCINPGLHKKLVGDIDKPNTFVPFSYVDFILTTANTWKTPIEDFTLIVERPHIKDARQSFVSFCWDGPVTKSDNDHFSAHIDNLVPQKELRVGFVYVIDRE
jgi:Domain of unknown function (DUF4424)